MNDWKKKLNIVYSTNPDFEYEQDETPQRKRLPKRNKRCAYCSTVNTVEVNLLQL